MEDVPPIGLAAKASLGRKARKAGRWGQSGEGRGPGRRASRKCPPWGVAKRPARAGWLRPPVASGGREGAFDGGQRFGGARAIRTAGLGEIRTAAPALAAEGL